MDKYFPIYIYFLQLCVGLFYNQSFMDVVSYLSIYSLDVSCNFPVRANAAVPGDLQNFGNFKEITAVHRKNCCTALAQRVHCFWAVVDLLHLNFCI